MKNELINQITEIVNNSKDYSVVLVGTAFMQNILDSMNKGVEDESQYPFGRVFYTEKDWEYAVLKDDLYVSEYHDDLIFVKSVDEATKFSTYGLDVKKLAKYVDGTVVEVFKKKSIKILQEGVDDGVENLHAYE